MRDRCTYLLLILLICLTFPAYAAQETPFHNLKQQLNHIAQNTAPIIEAADAAALYLIDNPDVHLTINAPTTDPNLKTLTRALAAELTRRPGAFQWQHPRRPSANDIQLQLTYNQPHTQTPPHAESKPQRGEGSGISPLSPPTPHKNTPHLIQLTLQIPNHPPHQLLSLPSNNPAAIIAAAWCFQVELFAAFTRHDKTPIIQQSFHLDTKRTRFHTYGTTQRFHQDQWLDPIAPGSLSQRYLAELKSLLTDIETASGNALDQAKYKIEIIQADPNPNRRVILLANTPFLQQFIPAQAGRFHTFNSQQPPNPNDYLITFGHAHTPGHFDDWPDIDLMRKTRNIVWITTPHLTTPRRDLRRGERLLDTWASLEDTCLTIPHYDTKLGPVSGVLNTAIYHHLLK